MTATADAMRTLGAWDALLLCVFLAGCAVASGWAAASSKRKQRAARPQREARR